MKKVVLVLFICFLGVLTSCVSVDYAKPVFEKPNSFVIDSDSVDGELEDNVRLYNKTKSTGISFKIYVHDQKNNVWKEYGVGNLKGPGDTEYVKSKLSGDLDDYRYFAIEALDGKKYSYNFYKKSDDLHINITDM